MSDIITAGASTTVDETLGLQNLAVTSTPASDADDNDTSLTLPTAFSTRLTALSVGTELNHALSGYTGAQGNTGSNAYTITLPAGTTYSGVAFTDSTGAAHNGTVEAGFTTTTDRKIFLYTDSANDNILLGRLAKADNTADASGAIVFAAYIEEGGSTGGKIWLVQYQAIDQGGANPLDYDNAVNLLNKVFVSVSATSNFNLAGAPSGQNLFLAFTKSNPTTVDDNGLTRISDVSIVATGKSPANQSGADPADTKDDISITTGDTVNTSQAGGPTTFGTNSQMITEQKGIWYSYVTGMKADVTIPNLDQNEADLESNIDFTGVYNTKTGAFDVVQLQSGKSAQVKVTAYLADVETKTQFVDGLNDDPSVAISQIRVLNGTSVVATYTGTAGTIGGLEFVKSGNSVTIKGVLAGYTVEFTTATDHNKVLIENGAPESAKGNDHADFDIGAIRLQNTASDRVEIGSKLIFEDDGPAPALGSKAGNAASSVDESDLAGSPPAPQPTATYDGASVFESGAGSPGRDGVAAASTTSVYELGLGVVAGTNSGLVDTLSNDNIKLRINATTKEVEGYLESSSTTLAFKVGVNAGTGELTLTLYRSVVHNDPGDPQEAGDSAAKIASNDYIKLTRTDTATDGDGDQNTATATVGVAQVFLFLDDGPSIQLSGTAAPTLATDDTNVITSVGPTSFAGVFGTPNFGVDGFKDSDDNDVQDDASIAGGAAVQYSLSVSSAGAESGLLDTATGRKIFLFKESNGDVTGRVGNASNQADANGSESFRIALNASNANVTLTQTLAIKHDNPNDPLENTATSAEKMTDANLVKINIKVIDGDLDSATVAKGIADAFLFYDDGPSTSANDTALLDDDALTGGNAGGSGDDVNSDKTSGTLGFATGKDGGSVAWLTTGAPATGGFSYELSNTSLLVKQLQGGVSVTVLTLTLNATSGAYTVTQNNPILHAADAVVENNQAFTINYRVTDGDGDKADGTLGVNVDDDSPTLAVGSLVGTGTDVPQIGSFARSAGADGPNVDDVQITLSGAKLSGVSIAAGKFTLTETTGVSPQPASPDGSGVYHWLGSLTGDFDNNASTPETTLTFMLDANPGSSRYTIDLNGALTSTTTTTDTALGGLRAGGPDPVQTLDIPDQNVKNPPPIQETVVFFSALIGAAGSLIATKVGAGQSDPSETTLEADPQKGTFIDPRAMNVSTAGIGVDNNNLNGAGATGNSAVIDGTDESFVVNPGSLVDKVRVFIDNSVAGYDFAGGERLQYRIIHSDGSVGNYTTVSTLTDGAKANDPKYFEVTADAGKKIDAVQLTMLYGEIKIPNIQFVKITESLAKDIRLDFAASLTDKDGDTVSTNFSVDLFTNKLPVATYDYELKGSALATEAFDVDLSTARTKYSVEGWNAGDKIVLIGGAVTGTPSITTSNGNTVITVDEAAAGAADTVITVIGVTNLVAADIVLG